MDPTAIFSYSLMAVVVGGGFALVAEWLRGKSCSHEWHYRGIYGDERLTAGHTEEWWCPTCGKHTFKDPTK